MSKKLDLNQFGWHNTQEALSSLSGFSLVIYDPTLEKPCTSHSQESNICQLVHEVGSEPLCQQMLKENVALAIDSQEILFFKCQANLTYFVIPIRLLNGIDYAVVGGKAFFSEGQAKESDPQSKKETLSNVSSEGLSAVNLTGRTVTKEDFGKMAGNLKIIISNLLEDIYRRVHYQTKSAHLNILTDVANQFRKNPDQTIHYATLLNTLGILFDFKSACIFQQNNHEGQGQSLAVFGENQTLLDRHDLLLNDLFEKGRESEGVVFISEIEHLTHANLPIGTESCILISLVKNDRTRTTLAILNTLLIEDDIKNITSFCQQFGSILENITLQDRLSEQIKTIQSLSDLTTFDAELSKDTLYSNLISQTADILGAEQGSIMMIDTEKNELSVKAMKGVHSALYPLFNKKPGDGIVGQVYQTGRPLLVEDLNAETQLQQHPRPRYKTTSFVSIPLKKQGRTFGVISFSDKINGETFTEADLLLLQATGGYISMIIQQGNLYTETEELKQISITDPLTGLLNRRYFQSRLTEELERTVRYGLPTCLILLDIDDFKKINDTYGHATGDYVLKHISRILGETIRTIDVASRYGGDEFTVILPNTSKGDAEIIGTRICESVASDPFQMNGQGRRNLTVSAGLASFPEDAETFEELVRNTDKALYQAKRLGKNRVCKYRMIEP
ncbi:MAG: diguanylate cyclase [Nitrospiria bacterium]